MEAYKDLDDLLECKQAASCDLGRRRIECSSDHLKQRSLRTGDYGFLLGPWIADATKWANESDAPPSYYEWQARSRESHQPFTPHITLLWLRDSLTRVFPPWACCCWQRSRRGGRSRHPRGNYPSPTPNSPSLTTVCPTLTLSIPSRLAVADSMPTPPRRCEQTLERPGPRFLRQTCPMLRCADAARLAGEQAAALTVQLRHRAQQVLLGELSSLSCE